MLTKTAIAGNGNDLALMLVGEILRRRPCAHGGGKAEADRAEVARHQNALSARFELASERVGVIAYIDRHDGVRPAKPLCNKFIPQFRKRLADLTPERRRNGVTFTEMHAVKVDLYIWLRRFHPGMM